ncbi:MAG: hypothetical protein IIB95_06370 [Candidatus Marinimicrobia bacterium]|nr:hypothetical protein [Candidatus Neomarinimicrobiota bacterium]MCH7763352.1 hypothetical protein [Candidatus Neomarinimicrobiota bacterium]
MNYISKSKIVLPVKMIDVRTERECNETLGHTNGAQMIPIAQLSLINSLATPPAPFEKLDMWRAGKNTKFHEGKEKNEEQNNFKNNNSKISSPPAERAGNFFIVSLLRILAERAFLRRTLSLIQVSRLFELEEFRSKSIARY